MRSKIISGMSNRQAVYLKKGTVFGSRIMRKHHGVHYGDRAGEAPGPAPGVPEGASFFAPMISSLTEEAFGYEPTFTRSSDVWYWDGAAYQVAGNDTPAFEPQGLLREPASTNACINHNANPDVVLANLTKGGDAASVMSRVSDAAGLAAAGLSNICSSGFVVELDNSAGTSTAYIDVTGGAATGSIHTVSAWAAKISGAGASTLSFISGSPSVPITSPGYTRASASGLVIIGETLRVTAGIGDTVRFVLNQLEAFPVPTSPIITIGASSSRAVCQLRYEGSDTFLPDASTVLMMWKPSFSNQDQNVKDFASKLIALTTMSTSSLGQTWVYIFQGGSCTWYQRHQNTGQRGLSRTNTQTDSLARWAVTNGVGAGTFQLWAHQDGSIDKISAATGGPWFRSLTHMLVFERPEIGPSHITNLIIYPETKTEQWLNDNWLGDGLFPP